MVFKHRQVKLLGSFFIDKILIINYKVYIVHSKISEAKLKFFRKRDKPRQSNTKGEEALRNLKVPRNAPSSGTELKLALLEVGKKIDQEEKKEREEHWKNVGQYLDHGPRRYGYFRV